MKELRYNRRHFVAGSLAAATATREISRPAAPATNRGGKLRAGAAASNITPHLGCSLAGNMTDQLGAEVHDELHVRCLVLDNGSAQLALVTCDLCAAPRQVLDRAKRLIQEHCGIPPSHVLVAATHTHSAPAAAHIFQSWPDPSYLNFLVLRIADAVRCAMNRLEPARIGWGVGREERLVFNRRYVMKPGTVPPDLLGGTSDTVWSNPGIGNPNVIRPAGPIDPDVGVLAVEALDGRPICVAGNYALHDMGDVAPGHISADYFGAWALAMAKLAGVSGEDRYPPFVAMLTNGCSGDINNIDVMKGIRTRLPPYQKMRQVAGQLAAEAYRVWRKMDFTESVELAASIEEVQLGVRLPSEKDLARARQILSAAPPGELRDKVQIYARETVLLAESYPKRVQTPVQAMKIGPVGLGAFPGEAFVELGLEVKAKSPFQPTLLIELANDYRGYIPTLRAFQEGGYETWRAKSSYLEPAAASVMTASILRQLGALAS